MSTGRKQILLSHGSGGKNSRDIIHNLFFKYFANDILMQESDSAVIQSTTENMAFTTDSFVVDPLFFPGGNIGKLAVCGTVNDLAVSGAVPMYVSVGFILEEGLEIISLEKIVESMAETASTADIKIVTGDTKVINRGKCDKLFINTSGIGFLKPEFKNIGTGKDIKPGDKVLINGNIAEHGMAVMSARNELKVQADIQSDCAPLHSLIQDVLNTSENIHFMRDATRGGLGTVLAELVQGKSYGIQLEESRIPIRESVRGMCEFFGFDPLYIANEGKVVMVASEKDAEAILETMQNHKYGKDTRIIGDIVSKNEGRVIMQTQIGGKRIIDMLVGEQLPRIC